MSCQIAQHLTSGRMTATDLSVAMVNEARSRTAASPALPLAFETADVNALPFANGCFTRVYADRVLHILPDSDKAIQEIYRVCAHDAKVVVCEPDWDTLTITGSDHTLDSAVKHFIAMQRGMATGR